MLKTQKPLDLKSIKESEKEWYDMWHLHVVTAVSYSLTRICKRRWMKASLLRLKPRQIVPAGPPGALAVQIKCCPAASRYAVPT